MKRNVVIGFIGTKLDSGTRPDRWERWRPTIDVCRQPDMAVDRFELFLDPRYHRIADQLVADIALISPQTEVVLNALAIDDPWDLEEVYGALLDWAELYRFDTDAEDYLLHITTGTHVAQISLFLLAEARFMPARILQLSPPPQRKKADIGQLSVLDLDLSRYDRLADRMSDLRVDDTSFLKSGIKTDNAAFNAMIEEIEEVAIRTTNPVLLAGPTGAGKSRLARAIFDLKRRRNQIRGEYVAINCATLRGEGAMSALFGHRRGAFHGATKDRAGLLRAADKGLVFLDEIEALGLDEQAMILGAVEDGAFYPLGADEEVRSDFQLIAGTTVDLTEAVADGAFREDLLARIDMWRYDLPGLAERREDIAPNLDFELSRFADREGRRVTFNKEARAAYLSFATSPEAAWSANFRDLSASVTRLCTFTTGARIDRVTVEREIERLRRNWRLAASDPDEALLVETLGRDALQAVDPFDRPSLAGAIRVCAASRSLSEAGRTLFSVSRTQRKSTNDADRLKKYLARHGLRWDADAERHLSKA